MWWMFISLFLGLALIIKGGDLFVASSVRIAELLKMPRVVIGSTLVSLATTTPEMVVSLMSGLKGESGLAVGNAVGSCICNIGLILGVMAVAGPVVIKAQEIRTPLLFMLGCGLLLFAITFDLVVTRYQGLLLLALGIGYFVWDFKRHQHSSKAIAQEAETIQEDIVESNRWLKTKGGTAAVFLLGAVLVTAGSKLLVDGAVGLAEILKIPSIIVGLTVVAVGTSLPELVTALTSSRNNVSDLAVGNVLGANIANMTLIVGSAATLHEVSMTKTTQLFNFPAMLVFMFMLLAMIRSKSSLSKREGAMLLGTYAIYLGALVLVSLAGKS